MPAVESSPGAGATIMASAQVLSSKIVVIGNPEESVSWETFAPTGGAALNLREKLILPVNNLQGILISAYQYAQYDEGFGQEGGVIYPARTNLEWRVVFCNPPDEKPELEGFVSTGNVYPLYGWVPITSPMLLIPGVPVNYKCCCAGFSLLSIEVRSGAADLREGQGRDLVVFSFSASQ